MTNITVKIEDVKLKSDTITAKGQVDHQNELLPFYVEYTIGDNQTKVSFGLRYVSEKFEQAFKEVVKNNALSQVYPTLIGRRMKGFVFDSGKYNDLSYTKDMDAFVGKEGIIGDYDHKRNMFTVVFGDDTLRYYPAHLALSCLVPEVYFPELPIGTLCWVWSDDKNVRHKRYVDCKGCDRKPEPERGITIVDVDKQKTIEKAAEANYNKKTAMIPYPTHHWTESKNLQIQNFIEGAEHQAKRMYSEEEVIRLLQMYRSDLSAGVTPNIGDTTPTWFEQHKKK